jgi:hypothetical protein
VICRWQHPDQITLDLMPTNEKILGFSNPWYADAITSAVPHELEAGLTIRVVTPPYFCATKLAAFHGRGQDDYVGSHDLEDLIALVDGRPELTAEIREAKADVCAYLAREIRDLLANERFFDALPGQIGYDITSQERLPLVMERLSAIAAL